MDQGDTGLSKLPLSDITVLSQSRHGESLGTYASLLMEYIW
jgi:hypothetical protein